MSETIIKEMNHVAEDFVEIASKVNESSKDRKKYSESSMRLIKQVAEVGRILGKEFETVSRANEKQRTQDNTVLLACQTLQLNVNKQVEIFDKIKSKNVIDNGDLDKIASFVSDLNNVLSELIENSGKIVNNDNQIILLDRKLSALKSMQLKSLAVLKDLTQVSFEEAEKAIEGSASNLDRGLEMVSKYKKVDGLVKAGNRDEINNLLVEANRGWNIAVNVNKNSISQLEFAEKVRDYTSKLHIESIEVRDLVKQKHQLFEETLQIVTVVTVAIAIKLKKYIAIEKIIDEIKYISWEGDELRELDLYANIAINDIKKMISLNYDMTDNSHLNNENETKTVELTDQEIEIFSSIKSEVDEMTKATAYPIEGSNKNISNGQKLENMIKDVLDTLK
jgi:hypothetical protein